MKHINKKTSVLFLLGLKNFVDAAECPFGYGSDDSKRSLQSVDSPVGSGVFLKDILTCTTDFASQDSEGFTAGLYHNIVQEVIALYDSKNTDDRDKMAGCLVRLAGHDFMDFHYRADSTWTGGSDGCINFSDVSNSGLEGCINQSNIFSVYNKFCGQVSLGDFVVIVAEALLARTSPSYINNSAIFEDGTLGRRFRDNFQYGRVTSDSCTDTFDLMPDPELACSGLQDVFVDRIFKDRQDAWYLTAAISGAHVLGEAKADNSGYEGSWMPNTDEEKQFTNDYFKQLLGSGWGPDRKVNDNPDKNQWIRIDKGFDPDHKQLMLTTDLCLAYETNRALAKCRVDNNCNPNNWACRACKTLVRNGGLGGSGELDLESGDCCAWSTAKFFHDKEGKNALDFDKLVEDDFCGSSEVAGTDPKKKHFKRPTCCSNESEDSFGDCDNAYQPQGPAILAVQKFANDEDMWLDYYLKAWNIATTNGQDNLEYIQTNLPDPIPILEGLECPMKQKKCEKTFGCIYNQVGFNERKQKPRYQCQKITTD